ncbi:flavohemoprotein, partial [Streptomyces sp. NPDC039028]
MDAPTTTRAPEDEDGPERPAGDGNGPRRPREGGHEPRIAAEPSADAVLVRRTLTEIAPVADRVTSYFYALLFLGNPGLRELFPAAMDTQR